MTNEKIELKRVNLNLPVQIVEKVNNYAHTLGINNTSAYIILLNQALEQKDVFSQIPAILSMYSDLKKGMLDTKVLLDTKDKK